MIYQQAFHSCLLTFKFCLFIFIQIVIFLVILLKQYICVYLFFYFNLISNITYVSNYRNLIECQMWMNLCCKMRWRLFKDKGWRHMVELRFVSYILHTRGIMVWSPSFVKFLQSILFNTQYMAYIFVVFYLKCLFSVQVKDGEGENSGEPQTSSLPSFSFSVRPPSEEQNHAEDTVEGMQISRALVDYPSNTQIACVLIAQILLSQFFFFYLLEHRGAFNKVVQLQRELDYLQLSSSITLRKSMFGFVFV